MFFVNSQFTIDLRYSKYLLGSLTKETPKLGVYSFGILQIKILKTRLQHLNTFELQ